MQKHKYNLNQSPFYKLNSHKKLIKLFKTTKGTLNYLLSQGDNNNYYTFTIPQENKDRDVQVPKKILRKIHKKIFELLSRINTPSYLHSATKKLSYVTNAHSHLSSSTKSKHASIDIKSFFQCASKKQVFNFFFSELNCSEDIARTLSKLCTFNSFLPTGSSISPILSFFSYKKMFDEINNVSQSKNIYMSLYVDDISLSGEKITPKVLLKIKDIISNYKLTGHKIKTYGAGQKRIITGIVVNPINKKCDITNKRHQKINSLVHQLRTVSDTDQKIRILKELTGRYFEANQVLHKDQENNPYYNLGLSSLKRMKEAVKNSSDIDS